MSNPYSQPSLTGYNASPPSDDGTEGTGNQVEWAKHITKIGDPLKTFAEAVDAAALAAHGLEFGAAVLTKSTNYTVAAADRGRFISVTGTTTISLPAAASAGEGFPVAVINTGSGVVTLDGDSSETINGAVTQTLNPGGSAIITSDGNAWYGVINGSQVVGSFSATVTGGTDGSATTFDYRIVNDVCTLHNATTANVVNSTSTALTLPSLPSAVQPTNQIAVPCLIRDNGSDYIGLAVVSGSTITFHIDQPFSSSGFTASGVKGIPLGWAITYPLT